jgi:nicotinamide-nucleotide amidase
VTDAEIIAVGSEMLTSSRVDTDSLYLTSSLNALGVEVVQKCIVGDDRERLASAVRGSLERSQILIVTGGLGPTEDDVTRDGVAAALGREQVFHQDVCNSIEARFRRMNRKMAENNRRQAMIIAGAEVLPNDRGTAPGQWIREGEKAIALLPGPPRELEPMFEAQCLPRLQKMLPQHVIRTRFYRVAGMGESDVDQLIAPVYRRYTNPACTILAGPSDIQIHLRARCETPEEAERLLAEVGQQIEPLLGDRIYTKTGETLEAYVGRLLTERGQTLCVAESATGGTLAGRLTSLSGSSKYFRGGFIAYTDDVKRELLSVDPELLRTHGAVSEPVARAMAIGALQKLRTDYSLSVTGYAGPDGGDEKNPTGTVFIGCAGPSGVEVRRFQYVGDRNRIRKLAAQMALDFLRGALSRTD